LFNSLLCSFFVLFIADKVLANLRQVLFTARTLLLNSDRFRY
jgi:hypothetical protein